MTLRRVRALIGLALDTVTEALDALADMVDPPAPCDDVPAGYFVRYDEDRGEVLFPTAETVAAQREASRARLEAHERLLARVRHPSTLDRPETLLGDVAAPDGPLAEVVPLTERGNDSARRPRPEESP